MSENGNGDPGECDEGMVTMDRDQFLLHTIGQSAVERVGALLHIESRFDAMAAMERDDIDYAAVVQVKAALIGLGTSMPELIEAAVTEIKRELGVTEGGAIEIAGSIPQPDLSKTHAANPEKTFTECHAMIPTLGLKLAPGIAQVNCPICIEQLKLKR